MNEEARRSLTARGVVIPDPQQVFVGSEVSLDRIEEGCALHPGTRLYGAKTLIRPGAQLGTEGPAVVRDCAIGRDVRLASGSFSGAVFLDGASCGPAGHVRQGTLLEEGASAAHAVGMKETILLPFATLGSCVNFCDALLAGGTSRRDHSEVGSGFIHFNFTPFGPAGDKATPSLFGDVVRGVWLREKRIFLGGSGGVVGPLRVGYGTVLAAGSVYRKDRAVDVLVYGEPARTGERSLDARIHRRVGRRFLQNLRFMSELAALHHFYRVVRVPLAGADAGQVALVRAAVALLESSLRERVKQLVRLADGLEPSASALEADLGADHDDVVTARAVARVLPEVADGLAAPVSQAPELPESIGGAIPSAGAAYVPWVRELSEDAVSAGREFLRAVSRSWLTRKRGAGQLLSVLPNVPGP